MALLMRLFRDISYCVLSKKSMRIRHLRDSFKHQGRYIKELQRWQIGIDFSLKTQKEMSRNNCRNNAMHEACRVNYDVRRDKHMMRYIKVLAQQRGQRFRYYIKSGSVSLPYHLVRVHSQLPGFFMGERAVRPWTKCANLAEQVF